MAGTCAPEHGRPPATLPQHGSVGTGHAKSPMRCTATSRRPRSPTTSLRCTSPGAYTQTVTSAAAASYAHEVLDEGYRRGFRDNGIWMQQLAECRAARDHTEQFAAIRDELADRWRRT